MRVHQVASKEIRDVGSSGGPWLIFVAFVSLLAYVATTITEPLGDGVVAQRQYLVFVEHSGATTADTFIAEIMPLVVFFVPIAGLVVGYGAIVPERETNSIRTLLALPYSRLEIIVGKLAGRIVVFSVPLFVGVLLAGVVAGPGFENGFIRYLLFATFTADLGVAFVCVGVGLSASLGSSFRVLVAILGVYFVLVFVWQLVSNATGLPMGVFDPVYAYTTLVASLSSDLGTVYTVDVTATGATIDTGPGLYFSEWVGVIVLSVWHAVPVVVGYRRFASTDL